MVTVNDRTDLSLRSEVVQNVATTRPEGSLVKVINTVPPPHESRYLDYSGSHLMRKISYFFSFCLIFLLFVYGVGQILAIDCGPLYDNLIILKSTLEHDYKKGFNICINIFSHFY